MIIRGEFPIFLWSVLLYGFLLVVFISRVRFACKENYHDRLNMFFKSVFAIVFSSFLTMAMQNYWQYKEACGEAFLPTSLDGYSQQAKVFNYYVNNYQNSVIPNREYAIVIGTSGPTSWNNKNYLHVLAITCDSETRKLGLKEVIISDNNPARLYGLTKMFFPDFNVTGSDWKTVLLIPKNNFKEIMDSNLVDVVGRYQMNENVSDFEIPFKPLAKAEKL
jgi:hypothetical protein